MTITVNKLPLQIIMTHYYHTFSPISWSILNKLPRNLNEVELIFQDKKEQFCTKPHGFLVIFCCYFQITTEEGTAGSVLIQFINSKMYRVKLPYPCVERVDRILFHRASQVQERRCVWGSNKGALMAYCLSRILLSPGHKL